ncbi:MAG: hypothetical protein ACPG77_06495, partial [Nannocystaceae bacterium]
MRTSACFGLLVVGSLFGCDAPATSTTPPPGQIGQPVAGAPQAQPGYTAQPGVAQPGVAQPGVAQPGVAQPGTQPVAQPNPNPTGLAEPTNPGEALVSRSLGVEGGVIIFWPRIVPRDIVPENRELARALQAHVRTVVERNLPGRPIDFRPEPERVCPRGGCKSMTIGTLISRQKQGCLVMALISRPGESPTKIVPWAGTVTLKNDTVPFREYPETQITVADYLPCNSL